MKNINIISDKDQISNNPFPVDSSFSPFVGSEVAEYFFACYGKEYSTNIMMEEYLNYTNINFNLTVVKENILMGEI